MNEIEYKQNLENDIRNEYYSAELSLTGNDDEIKRLDKPISKCVLNKKDIGNNVNSWVKDNLNPGFEFREYQFDTIVDIIYKILENKEHNQIIEAPTGSGKSLLNIISAGVLADYYKRDSYILCSDLYLWDQYYKFIQKTPALNKKFGVLKGQTGNYHCAKNDEDMRNADCRMAGISWGKLFSKESACSLGYECASKCQYVKERKKALITPVTLMTYQLFLFQINVICKNAINNPDQINGGLSHHKGFTPRDIIFCDECHNIPSIVEKNCEPCIKESDFDVLYGLWDYSANHSLDLFTEDDTIDDLINKYPKRSNLERPLKDIWSVLSNDVASAKEVQLAMSRYKMILNDFNDTASALEARLSHKKMVLKKHFTKEDVQLYKLSSFYRNYCCVYGDLLEAINNCGYEYLIKEVNETNDDEPKKLVTLKCAKEDYLTWISLMRWAHNRVMMSATIGGYDAFCENVGIQYTEDKDAYYKVIPSTFDFSKSPVHFFNRYKMSWREKENSFKALKPIIYGICEKRMAGKKGMIQTGSYANAKEIYDSAPPNIKQRLLLYNGSREKTQTITMHKMSEDTILIGPTLVEGVDLPGDDCRFIIILKVPYPVIVDKYVKKKIELFPLWYNSTTSNTIIQGIGRGNRYKDDWCVTYILDACFLALYNNTRDQYPEELQKRIKIVS